MPYCISYKTCHSTEVSFHSFQDFTGTCEDPENAAAHSQRDFQKLPVQNMQHQSCQERVVKPEKMSDTERSNKQKVKRQNWPVRRETSYHESISPNTEVALTQQCEQAITAAK